MTTDPDQATRDRLAAWLHGQYGEHTQPHSARVDSLIAVVAELVREGQAKALETAAAKIMRLWDAPVPAIETAFDAVVILRADARAQRPGASS